jgi:hypothetical protein
VFTAHVIAHELAHCQGIKHRKMHSPRYKWCDESKRIWGWAADYPITMNTDKTITKPSAADKVAEHIEKCQDAMSRWERKAKVAKTKIGNWKRRLKYYEKRASMLVAVTVNEEVK